MLKNKAQIARESSKTTLQLPGPLSGPWTPPKSEFGSTLVMCVRAHNLLCPPPLNENPGSAPGITIKYYYYYHYYYHYYYQYYYHYYHHHYYYDDDDHYYYHYCYSLFQNVLILLGVEGGHSNFWC